MLWYKNKTNKIAKMMTTSNNTGYYSTYQVVYPTAKISVRKNAQKNHYNGANPSKVYLEDGTEFEIELFNPKQTSVLAKISINGKSISNSGLIVKPGQRIFLDRFIDVAKKFKFETYEVSNTSTEVKEAIKNNGLIEISFYDELYYWQNDNITWIAPNTNFPIGNNYYNGTTLNNSGTATFTTTTTSCFSSQVNDGVKSRGLKKESLETGRVEQGGKSDTKFVTSDMSFNSYILNTVSMQILPKSVKPIEAKDLAIYCHGCGRKNKKHENFCPSCGTKIK